MATHPNLWQRVHFISFFFISSDDFFAASAAAAAGLPDFSWHNNPKRGKIYRSATVQIAKWA
jgi:hypothetical protein